MAMALISSAATLSSLLGPVDRALRFGEADVLRGEGGDLLSPAMIEPFLRAISLYSATISCAMPTAPLVMPQPKIG